MFPSYSYTIIRGCINLCFLKLQLLNKIHRYLVNIETCRSCFNVNFNANFKVVFKTTD